jgi:hypothetical protein
MPVSVPHQDRVLVRQRDFFTAVTGVRAYPQAVMFQLLIKARFSDGAQPDLAFQFKRLLGPGGFDFGAEARDAAGDWRRADANFAGGGGGGGAGRGEPADVGNYEFQWWVPFTGEDQGLRLWCAWHERGVPRSEVELDMNQLHAAARASQPAFTD